MQKIQSSPLPWPLSWELPRVLPVVRLHPPDSAAKGLLMFPCPWLSKRGMPQRLCSACPLVAALTYQWLSALSYIKFVLVPQFVPFLSILYLHEHNHWLSNKISAWEKNNQLSIREWWKTFDTVWQCWHYKWACSLGGLSNPYSNEGSHDWKHVVDDFREYG